jgi:HSP20 family protein
MSQSLMERHSKTAPWSRGERWDPLGDLDQFNERMREFLDQTFSPLSTVFGEGWTPHVDIEEADDAYLLEAELPGVRREEIKIEQVGSELMISGELKQRERKGIVRRQARRLGQFAYRVVLPETVASDKIEAKLNDGVLTIRVPKSERAQRRQIEIKV